MNPRKQEPSFRSMQIISEKAQSLWAKAKSKIQNPANDQSFAETEEPVHVQSESIRFDLSMRTIAKFIVTTIIVSGLAYSLFLIRDKILILFLAAFIAIVIDSGVRQLERWHVPRSIAVLLLYIAFLSIAIFLIASLIPIVASQVQEMARTLNQSTDAFLLDPHVQLSFLSDGMNEKLTVLMQETLQSMGIKDRTSALLQFGQNLSTVAQSSLGFAVEIAGSVFNFFVNLILILVLAFFMQLEREKIVDFIRALMPRHYRSYFDAKTDAVYQKITQWFQGQLLLCLSIGVLVFIALLILRMPFALTLALLAAFTEFIPYAGPLIAALPSVFIALSQQGFLWALVVAGIYYIVQSCENNLLVPLIMKHSVGLSPIAIMFGMLVGVSFPDTIHPVVGIILAVPTTAIITIFVQDFYLYRKKR